MKAAKIASPAKSRGFLVPILLAVILAALFWKSFLSGYVHFSNDGPLGQQMTAQLRLPDGFTGCWGDLNGIGGNAGAFAPDINSMICWMFGPVGYAKFLAPTALFILGLGAWTFFRQLKLSSLAAAMGALATALNSTFFSAACWGVASQQIAIGMDFFALALVVSNVPETAVMIRCARWMLAGLCVGVNVMEGADNGAIFSVFIAAFVLFKTLVDENGAVITKVARGIGRITVIAVFAGFIATQTIVSLVGVEIVGIVGTGQDAESKAQHWDFATQWSIPKKETLGLFVPGLFGYKMDTPKDMMSALQDSYKGGEYWGGVGRDPNIDRYFDSGKKDSPPPGMMRFSGGGNYCGILVSLIAFWAMAQSLRRKNSVFSDPQRRLLWFWMAILVVSVLLMWGRFAPFYKFFYMLPYASTMRNPCKFIAMFSWAFVIIFAYGVHGLSRRYLEIPAGSMKSSVAQFQNWWKNIRGFDRKWTIGCGIAFAASVLAWLIYASEKTDLVKYLQMVGPFRAKTEDIAAFSIGQFGWFLLFFAAAILLFILVIAGFFSGRRARLGGILLGALLIVDLARGDLPWIIHWDYIQKYEVGTLNSVVDFLRDKPYEHRVAYSLPYPLSTPSQFTLFEQLYKIEWNQHHFLYYGIQCLDNIQNSRPPVDLAAFDTALQPRLTQDSSGQTMIDPKGLYLLARKWQLTDTRYLLGPAAFMDVMNQQLDLGQNRFRIVTRFNVVSKPGIAQPMRLEELTAAPNDNGDYALFEFTGALPRAKLYSNWQVSTNDTATLQTLADANFDAQQTVLVSTPLPVTPITGMTNQNSSTVEFKRYTPEDSAFKGKKNDLWKKAGYCYAPKDMMFDANAAAPSVLLLNDKYDSHWSALVDGKPAPIFRANYIMRGVYLAPGAHTVEFQFALPNRPLYVSLVAISVGILLCGFLFFSGRRNSQTTRQP